MRINNQLGNVASSNALEGTEKASWNLLVQATHRLFREGQENVELADLLAQITAIAAGDIEGTVVQS